MAGADGAENVKALLDKLMARQLRLMSSLSDRPADAKLPVPARKAPASAEALEAERSAVDSALALLAAGDMTAAAALLAPYQASAALTRTLTTLARMRSRQGDAEAALALLQRAEGLDPQDRKVWYFLAELFRNQRRHVEEADYLRRLVYAEKVATSSAYVGLVTAIVNAAPPGKHPRLAEVRFLADKLKNAQDLDPLQHIALAKALYPVGPLLAQARSHYAAADPCPPDQQDVTVRLLSPLEWSKRSGTALLQLADSGVRGRRPAVAELHNAWVLPQLKWVPVLDDGKVALANFSTARLKLRVDDPSSPVLLQCEHRADLRVPREMPVCDRPAMLLGGVGEYAADSLEYLGALAVVEALGVRRDLPLVVNAEPAPHLLSLLALLGYGDNPLIRVGTDRPMQFTHLFAPTRPFIAGRWVDPLLPRWFRSRLADTGSSVPQRKLFLHAAEAGPHPISNADAVIQMLTQFGYESIQTDGMSVADQVALFSTTSHVVAAVSSALTNMVFMPPGGAVIALDFSQAETGTRPAYFEALSTACGHRFASLDHPVLTAGEGAAEGEGQAQVDIAQLRQAVEGMT